MIYANKARISLLVDLRDFFFRFRVGGRKKKSSENDQLKANWSFSELFFFIFFYKFSAFFFFLISPETVKLVIGKPTVCIKSLNILSFS